MIMSISWNKVDQEAALKPGLHEQFEPVVETCYQDVYWFAYGLANFEVDAADLTQQTF